MQNTKQGVDFINLNTHTHTHTHTLNVYNSSCTSRSYQQWNWLSHLVRNYQFTGNPHPGNDFVITFIDVFYLEHGIVSGHLKEI